MGKDGSLGGGHAAAKVSLLRDKCDPCVSPE